MLPLFTLCPPAACPPACPPARLPGRLPARPPACLQFRQALFKLEFKARQQLPAQRGNGSARKRDASGASTEEARDQLSNIIVGDAAIRQQAMLHLRRLLITCSASEA